MAAIAKLPLFKRGDTFSYTGPLQLAQGLSWAARSHLRAVGAVDAVLPPAQNLTVTLTKLTAPQSAALGLTLDAGYDGYTILLYAPPASTLLWPAVEGSVTPLQCDIEYYVTDDATINITSDTFIVPVLVDMTHD